MVLDISKVVRELDSIERGLYTEDVRKKMIEAFADGDMYRYDNCVRLLELLNNRSVVSPVVAMEGLVNGTFIEARGLGWSTKNKIRYNGKYLCWEDGGKFSPGGRCFSHDWEVWS